MTTKLGMLVIKLKETIPQGIVRKPGILFLQ